MSVGNPRAAKEMAFAKPVERESLDVSPQDRASSLVVAMIVMLGVVVILMFGVWLSSRVRFAPPSVPVTLVEELGGGGSGDGAPSGEQQFEEVSPEEVKDLQEVDPAKTLQALTAVTSEAVDLESLEQSAAGVGNGQGTGTGDGRGPGPGGPGTATQLPDWEVRFNATTLDLYAQQLDFFGIELGAVGGGKKTIDYASKLAQRKPQVRTDTGGKEKRRYLLWRKGPLADADKALLGKAGIEIGNRIVLQFIPDPVERQMATLEAQHAKGRRLNEIRRTIFGVRSNAGKFEFYVIEQDYRTG